MCIRDRCNVVSLIYASNAAFMIGVGNRGYFFISSVVTVKDKIFFPRIFNPTLSLLVTPAVWHVKHLDNRDNGNSEGNSNLECKVIKLGLVVLPGFSNNALILFLYSFKPANSDWQIRDVEENPRTGTSNLNTDIMLPVWGFAWSRSTIHLMYQCTNFSLIDLHNSSYYSVPVSYTHLDVYKRQFLLKLTGRFE